MQKNCPKQRETLCMSLSDPSDHSITPGHILRQPPAPLKSLRLWVKEQKSSKTVLITVNKAGKPVQTSCICVIYRTVHLWYY